MLAHTINLNTTIIITQQSQKVKPFFASDKFTDKKRASIAMARKMRAAGYEERSYRMSQCADEIRYTYCSDCGQYHIKRANLCRDRMCPVCNWRLSLQRFADMRRLLITLRNAHPEYTYALVTLTVRNCEAVKLSDTIARMSRAWNLTLAQKSTRACLAGAARSLEITYNRDTHQLHPHMHIFCAFYDAPQGDMLAAQWLKSAAKKGLVVDAKAQNAQTIEAQAQNGQDVMTHDMALTKSILETFKYCVKNNDTMDMPLTVFRVVVSQIAGKRLISYTGIIKEYAKKLEMEMETVQDEDINVDMCRDCGSFAVTEVIRKWAFGESAYVTLKTDTTAVNGSVDKEQTNND